MKNYLDLPRSEREILAAEWWERNGQKADIDKRQIPLPFGEKEMVKPHAQCNFCRWEGDELTHREVVHIKLYGCPECGTRPVSIVDLWE